MGYIIPSLEELPDPTLKEFSKNPDYYWGKLREYVAIPPLCRHLGIPKIITDLFRKGG